MLHVRTVACVACSFRSSSNAADNAQAKNIRSNIPTVSKLGHPFTGSGNSNINGISDGRPASAPAVGGGQMRLPRTLVAECSAPLSHVTSTEVRNYLFFTFSFLVTTKGKD